MTGREMCERISQWLVEEHGVSVAPEEIWNLSPTGELWHVSALYAMATSTR